MSIESSLIETTNKLDEIQNTIQTLKKCENQNFIKKQLYVIFVRINSNCPICHGSKNVLGIFSTKKKANKAMISAIENLNETHPIDDFSMKALNLTLSKDQNIIYYQFYKHKCDHNIHVGFIPTKEEMLILHYARPITIDKKLWI